MGSQHKDHPKHKYIDTFYLNKMLHLFHLLLACVGLAATAPSSNYYHGHEIHCRTEYITLSTTEYEDIETHEDVTKEHCNKNAEKMCEDKHKRIPVRVSKEVPKQVCDEDDGYANPLSIPEFVENEVVIETMSSGKNDSDEDSDEDSSEEKKHSDEDDD